MDNAFNIIEVTSWVGLLALCGGLYCLYSCIMMKVKGEINEGLLLNKEVRYKKCKDKEAYIKEVFPLVVEGEIRGGQGNPVKLDKVRRQSMAELEAYMNDNNILDFLNYRQN